MPTLVSPSVRVRLPIRVVTARLAAVLLAAQLPAAAAFARVDARMFRYPDVSATQIAFTYAGDIWVVDKHGGTASRLSSPPGEETFPRFSPDGTTLAYSANYDGNYDVYVVPAAGGTPARVTYHPSGERLVDWTPGGDAVVFASSRTHGLYLSQLFRVSPEGGFAEKLPVPYGEFAAFAPDGHRIAYTTKAREFRTWKRYRGGLAPEIWLFDLETHEARNVSASDANDVQPMWHGDALYFLSDRGERQRYNLWVFDDLAAGGAPRQVTHFTDDDVTFPAIGPSEIVFQAGGRLYLLDLASEEHHEVEVEVVTDLATLKPRHENVAELVFSAGVSPSGQRAVFEARGEIFTVPAEHGPIRQLTRSSGVAERYPAWSPDGERVAYWSDRTGEYELVVQPAKGGDEETLTELGPGYRYHLQWSPDSAKIAFIDHTQTLRVLDVAARQLTRVDQGLLWYHPSLDDFEVAWSSDSRWLAYWRHLDTGLTAVFLFDTAAGESHQVTSGFYSDRRPSFDPGGKYLYYLSDRSMEPVYSDLDATWVYPNSTEIVAVPLRRDVPSPLAPRNDEEEGAKKEDGDDGDKADKGKDDEKKNGNEKEDGDDGENKKEEENEPVEIDLEGFEARAVVLPPEAGRYSAVYGVEGKVVYQRRPRGGASERQSPIVFYDLEEREEKTVLDDADGFAVSADGKKLLVAQDDSWAIVDLAPGAKIEHRLAVDRLETVVDPRAEWRQLFTEVWRTYRDVYYDPGLHGLDWEGLRRHYGALLDDAVTRWDVTFVIGELIGEINSSHTYVGGGDTETSRRAQVGLLGVDWELADGAYRIARIVRGAPWDAETRSPLAAPGVDVKEGDYVLAVNGIPLAAAREPWAAFEGLAETTVELTVNAKPTREGARKVLVETLANDRRLRALEWIESNRRYVDQATGGRVGYIYVPNTGIFGQSELVRQYTSQATRAGLIIDERWNAGGQLPDRFVELLTRQRVAHLYSRYGATQAWPPRAHFGPKVMLINGWAGSGGDAFPLFFREMNAGPLIGERTWGGLIGPATGHRLIDGGYYTAPPGRIYRPDGEWFAEGHGVDPDIPVVDDPSELARGRDPQLEAAIAEVSRLIEEQGVELPGPPPFEARVPEADGD